MKHTKEKILFHAHGLSGFDNKSFSSLSEVDSGLDFIKQHAKKYYILDNAANNLFYADNIEVGDISKYATLANNKYMVCSANYTVVKNPKDMIEHIGTGKSSVSLCEEKYCHRDVPLLLGVNRTAIPSGLVSGHKQKGIVLNFIIEAMSQGVPFNSTNVGNVHLQSGGMTTNDISNFNKCIDKLTTDIILYKQYSIKWQWVCLY